MIAFAPLALLAAFLAISFLYSLPPYLRLRSAGPRPLGIEGPASSVTTVEDAAAYLRGTGLAGWGLVRAAQGLVSSKMEYSRRNNWDRPARAFARGQGYCQQQAGALLLILRSLGVEARMVQCVRTRVAARPPRGRGARRLSGESGQRARQGSFRDPRAGHGVPRPGEGPRPLRLRPPQHLLGPRGRQGRSIR